MFPALFFLWLPAASALDLADPAAATAEVRELVEEWRAAPPDAAGRRGLAVTLQALGILEWQAGKPDEALAHLEESAALLAADDPALLADTREALALTLQDLGRLPAAEAALREVLAHREAGGGAKQAATLDHLALNLLFQGRYPEVAPLLDAAEAAAPADAPALRARLLGHRGRLLHSLGSHARAAAAVTAALALDFDEPELRLALQSQLALSQLRLGKLDEAGAGTAAAAEAAREFYRADPVRVVPFLNNLGAVALARNDPATARDAFAGAVELLESALGPDHPGLMAPLNNLGVACQALGDYAAARGPLERAAALQARHLPASHLRVAETRRNLARNALLAGDPAARRHVEEATALGLELLDRLIREGSERERLNFLSRFDLVSLPCATGDARLIADVLLASKARLLDALLGSAAAPAGRPRWQDVQATLPAGSALVDTCRFTTAALPAVTRYGAVVLLPDGPPRWVELGTEDSLQRWLDSFHRRLRWRAAELAGTAGKPPALKLATVLRALEREFWAPLGLPAGVRDVAFSPDGLLHFLPLPALLDDGGRPLASRFRQVPTVASGRDLLHAPATAALDSEPWTVLTVNDFPKSGNAADDDALGALLADLPPMPGTRVEAEKLRRLAPRGSVFLSGPAASEANLRNLAAPPAVLHLGCHAFFLHESAPPAGLPIDFDEHADLLDAGGLVLHGGALRPAGGAADPAADDLLFPEEIAGLPLAGTRLVTLSSCESGAGTPVSGEGLLGLRRAFALAGASEVVVALWPVADDSTPAFMERFYGLALASDRPAQALWQAQAEALATAAGDADAFERAVLRYAPFALSQTGPLATGPPIAAAPRGPDWWPALAVVPLAAFFYALAVRRWKRRSELKKERYT